MMRDGMQLVSFIQARQRDFSVPDSTLQELCRRDEVQRSLMKSQRLKNGAE